MIWLYFGYDSCKDSRLPLTSTDLTCSMLQCLVVLNDLASAYVISRQYKEGIDKYREACFRAEQMDDMENSLVAFYYNLGEVCLYILSPSLQAMTNVVCCLLYLAPL